MRVCPICRLGLRVNDPSGGLLVSPDLASQLGIAPGDYGSVCSECCAKHQPGHHCVQYVSILGDPFPLVNGDHVPGSYPGGISDSPRGLEQAPAWFCAICRRFAREGDQMQAVRLYPEDAPDEPRLFPQAQCVQFEEGHCVQCSWTGTYTHYCPECWQRERAQGLQHHRPQEYTRRQCDWHGTSQDVCPACGSMTRRREQCYYACGECQKKYWPAIVQRLKREKIVPVHFPDNTPPVPHMLA
jgi:hypothetical protein